MRTQLSLAVLLAATFLPAQGTQVGLPAFGRTYSSTVGTRGFFFQAPIPFIIDAAQVPDEAGAGVQNIEIYVTTVAPPAFSGTITPTAAELVFTAYNVPQTGTPLPTGGIKVPPGSWVTVIGACGTATMANSYAGTAGAFQTTLLGAPVSLARCGTQTNIFTSQGPNALWSEVNGSISRVELYVSPDPNFVMPVELVAVSETIPMTGTLSKDNASFRAGDFIRWNFLDPAGVNTGVPIWNTLNVGLGGSAPLGTTALIPGFNQLWAASTPVGYAEFVGGGIIGSPDILIPIPPGIFSNGDTVRMQAITLDPRVASATSLPINPSLNMIEFKYTNCIVAEDFDSLASGVGVYPTNWSTGGGIAEWGVDSGGTSSGSTGPNAAVSPVNYMYCETSSPRALGDTFIMNTGTYASNTFVNNSVGFQLSRVGATIGTLEIRMDDGTGAFATVLATYTGAEPSGLEWTAESIALPAVLPANVAFQFHYTRGSSFTGDIAIDDFCIN